MTLIKSPNCCTVCGKHLVRDPFCSGDYYNTINGYVLQEYCNGDCKRNGYLKPLISGRDPDFISKNMKKTVASRIAFVFRLGMIETKQEALSIETNNIHDWVREFSRIMNMTIMDVENFVYGN